MSKRHQSSRRRSYGRRQHEIREREERRSLPDRGELVPESYDPAAGRDEFSLFGFGAGRRLGFSLAD